MTILAFDTSMNGTSVGLGEEERSTAPERPRHSTELLPLIRAVGGFDADLEAIGVGIGPGGFTGLRIGIATARALASATGLPLRPVSSLRALAQGIDAQRRLAVIDARRGEVFAALYEGEEELIAPWVGSAEELATRASGAVAAGDGSVRFRGVLEAAGIEVVPTDSPVHRVSGGHLCRLAAQVADALPEGVLPDYLRAPDATPQ